MRVALLHNPNAGEGRHPSRELIELIRQAGHDVMYQSTKDENWAAALDEPADLVVAAGGDGTVDKVALELAGRGVPITIIPLGTANNTAEALGLSGDPQELIGAWPTAKRRPFDLGHVRGLCAGVWSETRFVESLGAGLFPRWMTASERSEPDKNRERKLRRHVDELRRTLEQSRPERYDIQLDGQDHSGDYLLAEVLNVGMLGPNIWLAPDADPGDGLLDVVLIDEAQRAGFAECLSEPGRNRLAETVTIRRGSELELRFDGDVTHVDGKLWSPATRLSRGAVAVHLRVSLEAHALEFLACQ